MNASHSVTDSSRIQEPAWTNWFGNLRCSPQRIAEARSELDVQRAVEQIAARGSTLRPTGGGHSLTSLVPTDGVVLRVRLADAMEVDLARGQAGLAAGWTVGDALGELRRSGAAMRNVGELRDATLAGAVSTGVHGTGIDLPCLAASVSAMRLVTADASVLELEAGRDDDLLRAARISLGMLGVITHLTVHVLPAYDLLETSFFITPEELAERWDEITCGHRHVSFFYLPHTWAIARHATLVPQIRAALTATDDGATLALPPGKDTCLVTVRDPASRSVRGEQRAGQRYGPMDEILLYTFDSGYREIEFAVDHAKGAQTLLDLRARLRDRYPSYDHPMLVRLVAGDDAYLSWFHGGPKTIFSVTDDADAPYGRILGPFEEFFDSRGGLPHWGKEHTLDAERLDRLQPGAATFRDIRRELDPTGLFLNGRLAELFA